MSVSVMLRCCAGFLQEAACLAVIFMHALMSATTPWNITASSNAQCSLRQLLNNETYATPTANTSQATLKNGRQS
jgi:hypothetical protein